jgi:hypothetical protein
LFLRQFWNTLPMVAGHPICGSVNFRQGELVDQQKKNRPRQSCHGRFCLMQKNG